MEVPDSDFDHSKTFSQIHDTREQVKKDMKKHSNALAKTAKFRHSNLSEIYNKKKVNQKYLYPNCKRYFNYSKIAFTLVVYLYIYVHVIWSIYLHK